MADSNTLYGVTRIERFEIIYFFGFISGCTTIQDLVGFFTITNYYDQVIKIDEIKNNTSLSLQNRCRYTLWKSNGNYYRYINSLDIYLPEVMKHFLLNFDWCTPRIHVTKIKALN